METADNTSQVSLSPVGGTVQIGTIVAYCGSSAPDTWLLCDGSAIPSVYSTLIGMFGSNTPNLAGRTLIGAGTGTDFTGASQAFVLGGTGGEYTHTLLQTEMPSHQHLGFGEHSNADYTDGLGMGISTAQSYPGLAGKLDGDNALFGSSFSGGNSPSDDLIAMSNGTVTASSSGATSAHNNTQPYYVINYIIYAGTN